MQSLLFGTTGLNLFSDEDGVMLTRLAGVCRTGRLLGARALTFGSPKNRDRSGLDDEAVRRVATDFFRRLGDA
ncbi:sugar phosphate isomerase/epimerase, partial [Salmonella enterica]